MILMYHGIVDDGVPLSRMCNGQAIPLQGFARQMLWLSRRYNVVSLEEYIGRLLRGEGHRQRVVTVTFDDGLDTTFRSVYPLLKDLGIPATFFVPITHLDHGPLLWFNVLNAVCHGGEYEEVRVGGEIFSLRTVRSQIQSRRSLGRMAVESGDVRDFGRRLESSHPISASVKAEYEGMTFDSLRMCARDGLVEIAAHTVSHPLLSQLDEQTHAMEVCACKNQLAQLTGKTARYFAYPAGDYTARTLHYVKEAGYEAALCTIPNRLGCDSLLELERIGVYSPGLLKLRLKAIGVATMLRRMGLRVG